MKPSLKKTFIGRRKELELLEKAYKTEESSFIPVYGRRRVGKSELILQFIKNKPAIYFLGKKASSSLQIREFLQESARILKEPLLATMPAESWKDVFKAISQKCDSNKKMIIVFDEFQWTVETSRELPSIIQENWDRYWQKQGNIFLILCGSYLGFMEKEVLGKKSPLFGRRTAQILLKPFGYLEAAEFHPDFSLIDKAKAYFICGGIPLYLRFFSRDASIATNIMNNFLNEFAPLYREPDFLLREELREVEKYYTILMALASGSMPSRLIAEKTGIDDRSLYYYLQNLVELDYVSRRYPLTGSAPVSRHVRYVLKDSVLRFWFRFVYPNPSYILRIGEERAFHDKILPCLDSYFGSCFEKLCREALENIYLREKVMTEFEVGEYWDKNVQIDVVGLRRDGWTDICECRWGKVKSVKKISEELKQKIEAYPNKRNATIQGRIFTKRKLQNSENQKYKSCCLEDLYSSILKT